MLVELELTLATSTSASEQPVRLSSLKLPIYLHISSSSLSFTSGDVSSSSLYSASRHVTPMTLVSAARPPLQSPQVP